MISQEEIEKAITIANREVPKNFDFPNDPLSDGQWEMVQWLVENIEEAFEIRDGIRSVYERLQDEQLVNSILDLPRKDQKVLLKRIKEMRKETTE